MDNYPISKILLTTDFLTQMTGREVEIRFNSTNTAGGLVGTKGIVLDVDMVGGSLLLKRGNGVEFVILRNVASISPGKVGWAKS